MFGLLDCNNFYASCECVFDPALWGRAVVVLSNNDGCVIARSPAARAMGIKMGTPAFQLRKLIDAGTVVARSSNYTLYGDMSARVMRLLAEIVPDVEIYSIDEAFFKIPDNANYAELGANIARYVTQSTGVPVSVGIGPTKTLAKVANHAAKKYPGYKRVCVIDNDEKRRRALELTPVDDVWGIGRRHGARLNTMGVFTAADFARLPRARVQKLMTVTGLRTWCELNGTACIQLEMHPADKQQICTSRSFAVMQTELADLESAVATFAARCGAKLRAGQLVAGSVMTFLATNRFRPDLPQCVLTRVLPMPFVTNDTRVIVSVALDALGQIYRTGFQYKKAGVIVNDITPARNRPMDLFGAHDTAASDNLMAAIDAINTRFGKNTVRLTAEIGNQTWRPMHNMLSPNYTTDINDIIEIHCK